MVLLAMLLVFAAPAMAIDCGDVNCDDTVNWADATDAYSGVGSKWAADAVCDGAVNWEDAVAIYNYNLNCCDDDNVLEYSVTIIEDYSDSAWLGDLPGGPVYYNTVKDKLDDAHWTEKFHEVNDSVDEPDFGTSNSGYQGLDEADFHYHLGHGYEHWLYDPDAECVSSRYD